MIALFTQDNNQSSSTLNRNCSKLKKKYSKKIFFNKNAPKINWKSSTLFSTWDSKRHTAKTKNASKCNEMHFRWYKKKTFYKKGPSSSTQTNFEKAVLNKQTCQQRFRFYEFLYKIWMHFLDIKKKIKQIHAHRQKTRTQNL